MNESRYKLIRVILIITVCLLAFGAQAELFKWKDADGNLIYSDQPPPGKNQAESEIDKEELPQIISVPAPKVTSVTSSNSTEKSEKVIKYEELTIVEPLHDKALRDNAGNVSITVRVLPDNFAETGAVLAIYMDGEEISKGPQTSVQLTNIDRGTHTLKAELLNSSGYVVKATRPTVFHLQRHHN